ncbi:MAG: class I SAM-dependent methyltransferase [Chromatiales bacterium]
MTVVGKIHSGSVFRRRVRVLSQHLCDLLPHGAQVLDVGCGDGSLDSLLLKARPDVTIRGTDVLLRPETHIPVAEFDGERIPYQDSTFDVVLLVDVLHHTVDPLALLREARRVSRCWIVVKDHTKDGLLAAPTLRFMDWFGNAHHGVVLPYNYLTEAEWRQGFDGLDLNVEKWVANVGLYPWPASHFFDRSLHFVARLVKGRCARS